MRAMLRLTLKNKQEYEFTTTSKVAEAVAMRHKDGGVFCHIEAGEGLSIDFRNVIAVQVRQLGPQISPGYQRQVSPGHRSIQAQHSAPPVQPPARPLTPVQQTSKPQLIADVPKTNNIEKKLYKIECKCGAEYLCMLFADCQRCHCRECNALVFVDDFAPKRIGDNKQPATLATNRYRVAFTGDANE